MKDTCLCCGKTGTLDIRYFWNQRQNTYEMEYHCSTLEGGCDFYRILPMMANRSDVWHDEEEEE
jgi:hypothetical protein|tara:strand:+ start:597 stop:788 length:192 start_codon:yes stop_codon:yes gene_type:complete